LDHWVLKGPNLLEHLVGNLWIQTNGAVLKLVEWGVKSLINVREFFFHPLDFAVILNFTFLKGHNFLLNFCQIGLSSFHILLGFH
jgi:hypothetical protein